MDPKDPDGQGCLKSSYTSGIEKERSRSMEQIIKEILDLEWDMMGRMENNENREEERPLFESMRVAQFATWPESLLQSYLDDLRAAQETGRNLQEEKFVRMLKNTEPEEYERMKGKLPELSAEITDAVREIWALMEKLNREFAQKYPVLGMSGRPLTADLETDIPSIETYQCSEMMTYSLKTLGMFMDFLRSDTEEGGNLVERIQANTITQVGFKSLEDAERDLAWQAIQQMGGQQCSSCGMMPAF